MFHVEHFARPRNPQGRCDFCVGNSAAGIAFPPAEDSRRSQARPSKMFHVEHFQSKAEVNPSAQSRVPQVRVRPFAPNLGEHSAHFQRMCLESGLSYRRKCSTWNILPSWAVSCKSSFPRSKVASVSPSQVRVQRTHPDLGHLRRDRIWKLDWLTNKMFHVEHFRRASMFPGKGWALTPREQLFAHLDPSGIESPLANCSTWNILWA